MIKIGQKLYEQRMRLGYSLEEVSKATKIRVSFLSAIEKGDYTKLPSSAYIQGFVKNYVSFLGLPQREYLALFRREFNEREYNPVLPEGFSKRNDIAINKFRFGSGIITVIAIFAVLLLYILYQYRYAFINPPLSVSSPKESGTYSTTLEVSGTTDPNAIVYVQDFLVPVDKNGNFQKSISVFPGDEVISIRSQNRFGKETEIKRHVVIGNE